MSAPSPVGLAYNAASRYFLQRKFQDSAAEIVLAIHQLPPVKSVWSNESALDASEASLALYRRKFAILLSSLFSVAWTSEDDKPFNLPADPKPSPSLQPLANLNSKSSAVKSYQALRTAQVRLLSPAGTDEDLSALPPSVLLGLMLAGKQLGQLADAQSLFRQWYESLGQQEKTYLQATAHDRPALSTQPQPPAMTSLTESRLLPHVDDERTKQCQSLDKALALYCTSILANSDSSQEVELWLDGLHLNAGGVLGEEKLNSYKQHIADFIKRQSQAAMTREARQLEMLEEMRAQNEHYKRTTSSSQSSASRRQPGRQRPEGTSSSSRSASATSSGASSSESQTQSDSKNSNNGRIVVSGDEDETESEDKQEHKQDAQPASSHLSGFKAFRTALSNFLAEERPQAPGQRPPPTIRQVLQANVDHWITEKLGVNPAFFFSGTAILLLFFVLLRARTRRRVRVVMGRSLAKFVDTVRMGTQARYL